MSSDKHRRPSASLIISILALVLAASGTAIAATKLVSGDGLIKKASLSGNRLRKHTLTGTQINLSKLGKVPSAKKADFATSAGSATNATNATNATHANSATSATSAGSALSAGVAANLTGLTRFIKTITPVGTNPATAAAVTLGTSGPLSIIGLCYTTGGDTHAATDIVSSVSGFWNSYENSQSSALTPNTPQDVSEHDADSPPGTPDYEDPYDGTFSAITGTLSNYITGLVSNGVNLTGGNDCTFAGFTSAS